MKHIALAVLILLSAGCAKKQAEDQAGTAARSAYTDVLDGQDGYIIENARIAEAGDVNAATIAGNLKLQKSTSSVLIIRTPADTQSDEAILAVQFASFAAGSSMEYDGSGGAQFWVLGNTAGKKTGIQTGLISGSLRFIKTGPSALDLGLNRNVLEGVGDIELVVANIQAQGLKSPMERKFAARFQLPIISLEEMIRINQPA